LSLETRFSVAHFTATGSKKIIDIVNGDVYIDAALSHITNNKSVAPDRRAGRTQGGLS